MEHLKEFIERCQENEFQEYVKEIRKEIHRKVNQWAKNNPEKYKKSYLKHIQTDKGKYSITLSRYRRRTYYKIAKKELTWEEKKLIGNFYKNCPVGYEVDHIIPISKGGLHRLSNLQYLTAKENKIKGAKLDWKK